MLKNINKVTDIHFIYLSKGSNAIITEITLAILCVNVHTCFKRKPCIYKCERIVKSYTTSHCIGKAFRNTKSVINSVTLYPNCEGYFNEKGLEILY